MEDWAIPKWPKVAYCSTSIILLCTDRFYLYSSGMFRCCWIIHFSDIIMSAKASQITSLMIVYSTVYSGADLKKTNQSSASLAFLCGEFPAQRASNAENVSIWWRHPVHATVSEPAIQPRGTVNITQTTDKEIKGIFHGPYYTSPDFCQTISSSLCLDYSWRMTNGVMVTGHVAEATALHSYFLWRGGIRNNIFI